jgi:predicted ArsR family transcriptional regulator
MLVLLRRIGPASPDRLAAALGASRTGILQQLRTMEETGLVRREKVRHGVGRPRHVYDITPAAQDQFPANYEALATDLVDAIAAVGGEPLVARIFDARRLRLAARASDRRDGDASITDSLADRARELAVMQDAAGYLCESEVREDGSVGILERNCAILRVASAHPEACTAELRLFEQVLGATVVREEHILAGDRCCSYRITEGGTAT